MAVEHDASGERMPEIQRRIEFGWPGDDGLGERLVTQIIDGRKTATCGFKAVYTPEELADVYEGVGELRLASSCGGPARCVIRVTEAFETSFGDPDPRLVAGEGDGEDVAAFQADHRNAWEADRPAEALSDDEVLVVEILELIEVLPAGGGA
jgi:uncharacterized protein YhfF